MDEVRRLNARSILLIDDLLKKGSGDGFLFKHLKALETALFLNIRKDVGWHERRQCDRLGMMLEIHRLHTDGRRVRPHLQSLIDSATLDLHHTNIAKNLFDEDSNDFEQLLREIDGYKIE